MTSSHPHTRKTNINRNEIRKLLHCIREQTNKQTRNSHNDAIYGKPTTFGSLGTIVKSSSLSATTFSSGLVLHRHGARVVVSGQWRLDVDVAAFAARQCLEFGNVAMLDARIKA